MHISCFSCGIRKDPEVKEMWRGPHKERVIDEPVDPLFTYDVQDRTSGRPWKAVVVCHICLDDLDPDMWISDTCWSALSPIIDFDHLPNLDDIEDTTDVVQVSEALTMFTRKNTSNKEPADG